MTCWWSYKKAPWGEYSVWKTQFGDLPWLGGLNSWEKQLPVAEKSVWRNIESTSCMEEAHCIGKLRRNPTTKVVESSEGPRLLDNWNGKLAWEVDLETLTNLCLTLAVSPSTGQEAGIGSCARPCFISQTTIKCTRYYVNSRRCPTRLPIKCPQGHRTTSWQHYQCHEHHCLDNCIYMMYITS